MLSIYVDTDLLSTLVDMRKTGRLRSAYKSRLNRAKSRCVVITRGRARGGIQTVDPARLSIRFQLGRPNGRCG